jgi:hypothetical protein
LLPPLPPPLPPLLPPLLLPLPPLPPPSSPPSSSSSSSSSPSPPPPSSSGESSSSEEYSDSSEPATRSARRPGCKSRPPPRAPGSRLNHQTTHAEGWEPETPRTQRRTPPLSIPSHRSPQTEESALACVSCPWRKCEERKKAGSGEQREM